MKSARLGLPQIAVFLAWSQLFLDGHEKVHYLVRGVWCRRSLSLFCY